MQEEVMCLIKFFTVKYLPKTRKWQSKVGLSGVEECHLIFPLYRRGHV